jgi:diguanylate cyclase (GGDEF)-like protein
MQTFNTVYKNDVSLKEFLEKIPKKENLIQVFSGVTDKKKIKHVLEIINNHYPGAKIIGSTTDGEIIDGKVTSGKIIISVSIFDKAKIKILLHKKNKKSYYCGIDFAKKIITDDTKVLIAFADGLNVNGEEFLKGVARVSDVIIAGGLAGDNGKFEKTYVFDNNDIIEKGCVGAVIEGDIIVNNEYGFNWEGIGKTMKVTKAIKNRVYEIDGKTPVEIYEHYFGEKDIVKIGVQFPLIINKGNMKVARAVVGQNNDGSLIFAGNINEGDEVQFGFGDISSILEKDKTLYDALQSYDIQSVFIYSCMARRRFLGQFIEKEIAPFTKFGSVSGFFTYGEFFKSERELFLNQTMTVLMLSEIENKIKIDKEDLPNAEFSILKTLTHLIKVTSNELNELNKHLEEKIQEKTKEVMEKNRHLEYLYYHNQLTGLPNRYMLDKDLETYDIYGGVLIDIKGFSKINDMYGEKVGDEVLINVGRILEKLIDRGYKLYKVGADQFLIIGYESYDFDKIVEKIKKYFENELVLVNVEGSVIALDLDIRMVIVRGNYKDIRVKTDLALNYARKNYLDFVEYDESLHLEERLKNEIKVLEMVKQALKEDRIVPVFQKIQKKNSVSYECLVRLKEGDRLIPPYYFLKIIEPTHYYFDITKTMIEKSFRIFSKRNENVSLNFTFKDIENDEIVDYLIDKVKEYNMQNRVIIELLESENIQDFEIVLKFIEKVKEVGVRIAIDDFGSGYSNFVYLAKLNPDFIKIDGSLIKNIHEDKTLYIITKHINDFAKDLGCMTIAEFVSDEFVYEKVDEIGVDGVQGYFIDKPKEEL